MPGAANPAGASGTLYVVATPIGNLEDVSARALRVLREVALIAAEDTRRTGQLLARHAIQTPTTSLNQHNEAQKTDALVRRMVAGESVALVSDAGTPTVSDPGGHLIGQAIGAGVRVEAIPGASAVLTFLAASGLPSSTFTFLGYPPTRSNDRELWFRALSQERRTVVFFEAPHRILETLHRIRLDSGDCHIVVGRELTKVHEQVLRGSVTDVITALGAPKGEFCVGLNLVNQQIPAPIMDVSDDQIWVEFDRIRRESPSSRRQAIQKTSRLFGLSTNVVYSALERHKKLAE